MTWWVSVMLLGQRSIKKKLIVGLTAVGGWNRKTLKVFEAAWCGR